MTPAALLSSLLLVGLAWMHYATSLSDSMTTGVQPVRMDRGNKRSAVLAVAWSTTLAATAGFGKR